VLATALKSNKNYQEAVQVEDEQIVLSADRAWQDQANCLGVDPDLFFPERGASTREAKEVCRGCVVRNDCLEYALDNGEKFGIWGGLSERERRRLRRQRAQSSRTIATA
jgi:WhiB family redox-sensing transcriptional regulator